jgi:hypothetical protein
MAAARSIRPGGFLRQLSVGGAAMILSLAVFVESKQER